MYIPMPFPKCKKCGKSSTQGYHRGCGGKLEFAPEKETIRCPKCAKQWNIWDTTYFCSCGNEFHSKEIEDSIVQLLYACKIWYCKECDCYYMNPFWRNGEKRILDVYHKVPVRRLIKTAI